MRISDMHAHVLLSIICVNILWYIIHVYMDTNTRLEKIYEGMDIYIISYYLFFSDPLFLRHHIYHHGLEF